MDVSDREDPGPARLKKQRPVLAVVRQILTLDFPAGQHEAVLVHRHVTSEPARMRGRADEHEQRLRSDPSALAGTVILHDDRLEPAVALERNDLGVRLDPDPLAPLEIVDEVPRHRLVEALAANE